MPCPFNGPAELDSMILERLEFRQTNTRAQIEKSASNMFFMAASAILCWLVLRSESSIYEFHWLASVLAVVLIRYIVNELLLRSVHLLNNQQRFILFNLSIIVSCGVWGAAGIVFFVPGDDAANGMMVVLMMTVVGSGAYSYINNFISLSSYVVALFSLPILVLVSDGSAASNVYASAMSVMLVYLLATSRKNEQLLLLDHVFRRTTEKSLLTDTLTELPNRAAYHLEIQQLRELIADSHKYSGLLLLNVDQFKEVNNIQGQYYGDLMLLEFSRRLRDAIPENVILARLGGVEFVLLLPNLGECGEEARRQTIKLSENILADSLKCYKVMDDECSLEVSIGATVFNNDSGSDADLLKFANLALDKAKNSGRNRYVFYNMEISLRVEHDAEMLKKLKQAARNKNFLPYYQPVFCVKTNKIKGAEVLLRWVRSENDIVAAAEFIYLLESTSLMCDISRDLIAKVCAQVAQWHEDGLWSYDTRIMFNLCAGDIRGARFVDKFLFCLEEHGLPAAMFEFEMTEREIFQDTNSVMEQLSR